MHYKGRESLAVVSLTEVVSETEEVGLRSVHLLLIDGVCGKSGASYAASDMGIYQH